MQYFTGRMFNSNFTFPAFLYPARHWVNTSEVSRMDLCPSQVVSIHICMSQCNFLFRYVYGAGQDFPGARRLTIDPTIDCRCMIGDKIPIVIICDFILKLWCNAFKHYHANELSLFLGRHFVFAFCYVAELFSWELLSLTTMAYWNWIFNVLCLKKFSERLPPLSTAVSAKPFLTATLFIHHILSSS